ncbi:pseudouridine synthase [Yangia sp. PrR003]|nr:pseudouridine synthase [Salipiger sp. PrR003]
MRDVRDDIWLSSTLLLDAICHYVKCKVRILSVPTGVPTSNSERLVVTKVPTFRIDKLLSSLGYGSRREVSSLVRRGAICFDSTIVRDVTKRIPVTTDLPTRLSVDGNYLDPIAGMVVILNKPLGVTCSHAEDGDLVYDLLPERWRRRDPVLSTVGRLDKQTSGLLLLTDDGDLLHRIISPKRQLRKTYRVTLARPLIGTEGELFASGCLMLKGEQKPLAPADLTVVSDTEVLLSVTEGRYHQVRRMFAATGNFVAALHREQLGGLSLPNDLSPGHWRLLGEDAINSIFSLDECARASDRGDEVVLPFTKSATRPHSALKELKDT